MGWGGVTLGSWFHLHLLDDCCDPFASVPEVQLQTVSSESPDWLLVVAVVMVASLLLMLHRS